MKYKGVQREVGMLEHVCHVLTMRIVSQGGFIWGPSSDFSSFHSYELYHLGGRGKPYIPITKRRRECAEPAKGFNL